MGKAGAYPNSMPKKLFRLCAETFSTTNPSSARTDVICLLRPDRNNDRLFLLTSESTDTLKSMSSDIRAMSLWPLTRLVPPHRTSPGSSGWLECSRSRMKLR